MAITAVQNAVRDIGIPFVGMKLFKTAALGIVKNVVFAGIGGSGIVKLAIGAPMVWHFLVKDVGVVNEGLYKKDHFLRDKTYPFMYGIVQKLPILVGPWQ